MNYDISISGSGKYIRIKVIGDMTIEVAGSLKEDADKLSAENNIKNLFLDLRQSRNKEKHMSNLSYSYYEIPKAVNSPFEKTAFLVDTKDNSHDIIIVAGTNAGHDFKRFTDEIEAINWIEG